MQMRPCKYLAIQPYRMYLLTCHSANDSLALPSRGSSKRLDVEVHSAEEKTNGHNPLHVDKHGAELAPPDESAREASKGSDIEVGGAEAEANDRPSPHSTSQDAEL